MPFRQPRSLRRCGHCNAVGHNRATCLAAPKKTAAPPEAARSLAPLKFFVHHVTKNPVLSNHTLDLKNHASNVWKNIDAIAPQESATPLYHFYHTAPSVANRENKAAPARPAPAANLQTFRPLNLPRQTFWSRCLDIWEKNSESLNTLKNRLPAWWPRPLSFAAVLGIFCAALIILVPFQAYGYFSALTTNASALKADSLAGFMALANSASAIKDGELPIASAANNTALARLSNATALLSQDHRALVAVLSSLPFLGEKLEHRERLLVAGHALALASNKLLSGFNGPRNASSTLSERVTAGLAVVADATPELITAHRNLNAVPTETLPLEYQAPFLELQKLLAGLTSDFSRLGQAQSIIKELTGQNGPRRWLVIFQNPSELRATGGFMGTFAVLDTKAGDIVKLEVPPGGTYDLQGQLDAWVEPPTPLLLANKRWEFQDANWFPDFPASAQKILWFYRHGRGQTADGVIAINASVLERLLAILGPVTDEKRGLTLTADSALSTIQKIVETGPEKIAHRPKQIVSDLAPRLLANLQAGGKETALPILLALSQALEQKEIQLFFNDPPAQNTASTLGWSGEIIAGKPGQDYLLVVNSNIQGAKSDAEIVQTIAHEAFIQPDGSIINRVTITRSHQGRAGDPLYGNTNIDYVRLYAPLKSQFISASGYSWPDEKLFRAPDVKTRPDQFLKSIEKEISLDPRTGTRISEEFGKTAFGNWLITEPGAVSRLQVVYRLPFSVFSETASDAWFKLKPPTSQYQLIIQRQSGANSQWENQIIYPPGWRPLWSSRPELELAENGARLAPTSLKSDQMIGLLMEQN